MLQFFLSFSSKWVSSSKKNAVFSFNFKAISHVQHYATFDYLEYELFRNNKSIGYHKYDFIRKDDTLLIKSEVNFKITKHGGYSIWIVKDHRNTQKNIPYIPFHSDLASVGERSKWKFHDLIILDHM